MIISRGWFPHAAASAHPLHTEAADAAAAERETPEPRRAKMDITTRVKIADVI